MTDVVTQYLVVRASGDIDTYTIDTELTFEVIRDVLHQDAEALAAPAGWDCTIFASSERTTKDGLERLRLNNKVTHMLQDTLWPGSTVVGDVIIAPPADYDGEVMGHIPEPTLSEVKRVLDVEEDE